MRCTTSSICLISGEYLHRDAFDVAEKYGKDTFLMINYLGTSRLPALFGLKNRFDAFFDRLGFLPSHLTDRMLQVLSGLFPSHLPKRMKAYRDKYEHHLLLKVPAASVAETKAFLDGYFAKASGGLFRMHGRGRRKGVPSSVRGGGCGRSVSLGAYPGCGEHCGARHRAPAQ